MFPQVPAYVIELFVQAKFAEVTILPTSVEYTVLNPLPSYTIAYVRLVKNPAHPVVMP